MDVTTAVNRRKTVRAFTSDPVDDAVLADLLMFLQTFMLLAQEAGLDTCPQEAWAAWEGAVSEFVGAPPELRLFCGVAIGHEDTTHPINTVVSEREPLEVFATFVE